VSAACDVFRKRPSAFPPSSGELYAECDKLNQAEKKRQEWKQLGAPSVKFNRLTPPSKRGWTDAELADWSVVINGPRLPYVMRVDASGNPLTVPVGLPGGGQKVEYGYLTPAEVQAMKARQSTPPARNWREAAE
jgi:hypothetical protein